MDGPQTQGNRGMRGATRLSQAGLAPKGQANRLGRLDRKWEIGKVDVPSSRVIAVL
jgi:hypothetical protein